MDYKNEEKKVTDYLFLCSGFTVAEASGLDHARKLTSMGMAALVVLGEYHLLEVS